MSTLSRISQFGVVAGWASIFILNNWLPPTPHATIENNTIIPSEREAIQHQSPNYIDRKDIYPPNKGVIAPPSIIETCALFPTEHTVFTPECPILQGASLIVLHDLPLKPMTAPISASEVLDDGNPTIENDTVSEVIDNGNPTIQQWSTVEQLDENAHRYGIEKYYVMLAALLSVVSLVVVSYCINQIDVRAVRQNLEKKRAEELQRLEDEILVRNEQLVLYEAEIRALSAANKESLVQKDKDNEQEALVLAEKLTKLDAEFQQLQETKQIILQKSVEQAISLKDLERDNANLNARLSAHNAVQKANFEQLKGEKDKALEESKKLGQELDTVNQAHEKLQEVSGRDKTAHNEAEESWRMKESAASIQINNLQKEKNALSEQAEQQRAKNAELEARISELTEQSSNLKLELKMAKGNSIDQINQLKKTLEAIQFDFSAEHKKKTDLQAEVSAQQKKESDLEAQLAAQQKKQADLEAELSIVTELRDQLDAELKNADDNLSEAELQESLQEEDCEEPDDKLELVEAKDVETRALEEQLHSMPKPPVVSEEQVLALNSSTPKQDQSKEATTKTEVSTKSHQTGGNIGQILEEIDSPTNTKIYGMSSRPLLKSPASKFPISTNFGTEPLATFSSTPKPVSKPELKIDPKNVSKWADAPATSRRASAQFGARSQSSRGYGQPATLPPRSEPGVPDHIFNVPNVAFKPGFTLNPDNASKWADPAVESRKILPRPGAGRRSTGSSVTPVNPQPDSDTPPHIFSVPKVAANPNFKINPENESRWASAPVAPSRQPAAKSRAGTQNVRESQPPSPPVVKAASGAIDPSSKATTTAPKPASPSSALQQSIWATDAKSEKLKPASPSSALQKSIWATDSKAMTIAPKPVSPSNALQQSIWATDAKAATPKPDIANTKEPVISSVAVSGAEKATPSTGAAAGGTSANKPIISTKSSTSHPTSTPVLTLKTTGIKATPSTPTTALDSPIVFKIAELAQSISQDKKAKRQESLSGPSSTSKTPVINQLTLSRWSDSPTLFPGPSGPAPIAAPGPAPVSAGTSPVDSVTECGSEWEEEEDDAEGEEEDGEGETHGEASTSTGERKRRLRSRGTRAGQKVQRQKRMYAERKERERVENNTRWNAQIKEAKEAEAARKSDKQA